MKLLSVETCKTDYILRIKSLLNSRANISFLPEFDLTRTSLKPTKVELHFLVIGRFELSGVNCKYMYIKYNFKNGCSCTFSEKDMLLNTEQARDII